MTNLVKTVPSPIPPGNPRTYQALAIASALELWAKHGIRANSAYTPRRMIQAAQQITGQTFRPREYLRAAAALREFVA